MAVFACRHSHFQGDDIVGLYQSHELPFWKYLATPIDVHFVPLHRLATYVLGRVAPASFGTAIAVLLGFHLLAIYFLHRTLEVVYPTWLNAVLAGWYGTHVYIGVLFTWWTSGLHRLPYVFLLALGLHSYVRYRWRPRVSGFFAVVACFVLALGFFEKALLIPVVLFGVEATLFRQASARTRRAVAALLVTLAVLAVAYWVFWRHAVGPEWSSIGGGASFLFTYLKLSWFMLIQSSVGRVYDGAQLGLVLLGCLVVWTVARRRDSAIAWLFGFVVVSVSLELTGVSTPRARAWGFVLATFSYRYYPDAMFLLVLFVALACHRALAAREGGFRAPFVLPRFRACAWPAVAALASVAVASFRASAEDLAFLHTNESRIRDYMTNVTTGLEPLRRSRTLPPFMEGQVPRYVNPVGGWVSLHSVLVGAMGCKARFVRGTRAAYRILPTGEVVFGA